MVKPATRRVKMEDGGEHHWLESVYKAKTVPLHAQSGRKQVQAESLPTTSNWASAIIERQLMKSLHY